MIFTVFSPFYSKSQTLTLLTFNHEMLIFILSSRTYDEDNNKDFYLAKELPTIPDFPTDYNEDQ